MEGVPVQAVLRLPQSVGPTGDSTLVATPSSAVPDTSSSKVTPETKSATPVPVPGRNGELTREEAETIAKGLEQSLNTIQVRFGVSVGEDARTGLHFKVVDKETGRVIREFPPEKAFEMKEKEQEGSSEAGRLFEGVA